MIAAHVVGALAFLVLRGAPARWVGAFLALIAGVFAILSSLRVLLSGISLAFAVSLSLPALALTFKLDPLGAVFLLLIGAVTIPVALFSIGYTAGHGAGGSAGMAGFMLHLFLLSMSLVVLAANVFTFLFFWETMSLASYFLVISENQDGETLSAGRWYAGMAHVSFGLIASALLIAALDTEAMGFDAIRNLAPAPELKSTIFILAFLGFGSKAGLVPLHVWLPKAHPAAPSHVSALMSGVMVKMGVYGIVRVGLDLLHGGPPWWGGLILTIGAASALIGVLYALMEQDLKRLLAYSTVENVGIVLMGVGLGFLFKSYNLLSLASLAMVAGFYHSLNHGLFKGLLFLGAGAVAQATGTRDMEKMGGLIRRMPQTASFFLVGSAAISALPPLNGFASEWMIFQSLLAGVRVPHPFTAALMAVAVGVLALTGGLAAACFVKAFGISFLAIPRSERAEQAHEAGGTMRAGMLILSSACVLLGVLPIAVTSLLSHSVDHLPGFAQVVPEPRPGAAEWGFGLKMQVPGSLSTISPAMLALILVTIMTAVLIGIRLLRVNRALRLGETWGCGRVVQTARMEYTSTAFAEPLRRVFGALFRPAQDVMIDFHPESKYFVQSIQYRRVIRTWFEEFLYEPLFRGIQGFAGVGRWIQSGSVHWYIAYVFIVLLTLLLIARWM